MSASASAADQSVERSVGANAIHAWSILQETGEERDRASIRTPHSLINVSTRGLRMHGIWVQMTAATGMAGAALQ